MAYPPSVIDSGLLSWVWVFRAEGDGEKMFGGAANFRHCSSEFSPLLSALELSDTIFSKHDRLALAWNLLSSGIHSKSVVFFWTEMHEVMFHRESFRS